VILAGWPLVGTDSSRKPTIAQHRHSVRQKWLIAQRILAVQSDREPRIDAGLRAMAQPGLVAIQVTQRVSLENTREM
jgi:hypothetical protein